MDAEGCFYINPKGYSIFTLKLRDDDAQILREVRDILGVGGVYKHSYASARAKGKKDYDQVDFRVFSRKDLQVLVQVLSTPSKFESWLAGFIDGEAHFQLYHQKPNKTVYPRFTLALRDDDRDVLYEIQRILGAGSVNHYSPNRGNGAVRLTVSSAKETERLIEMIDSGIGLRSKKKRDYEIWKQAVEAKRNGASLAELLQLKQELQSAREYRKL